MDTTPNESMREEARRYRAWKQEGRAGGTDVAARRASQILSGDALSPSTVRTMSAWFARHEVDKQAEGFRKGEAGYPSPGRVAWAAWGGDPGKSWSDTLTKQMDNADDRELDSTFSAGQAALYEAYEEAAEELGEFDQSSGAHGAHYMPESPFASSGLVCSNCAFFAGPRACEIVEGDIAPQGLCKFWIIPERLVSEAAEAEQDRPYPNEHAARLRDPSQYDRFRRRNNAAGRGIDFIFGIKSGESGAELQAIRFRLSSYTAAEARKWLSDNDYDPIEFEEATNERTHEPVTPPPSTLNAPLPDNAVANDAPLERALTDRFTRSAPITAPSDTDARTLTFPFSSEYPVERYFGTEVLSHSSDAADFTRLNAGAPVLFNHDPNQHIGVVERAWIDPKDKRGYVQIRFGRNALAQEKQADANDGILRNVSFGYQIIDMVDRGSGTYEATRWSVHEVSLVTIPADPTVGVDRSFDTSLTTHPHTEHPIPQQPPHPIIDNEPPAGVTAEPEVRQAVQPVTTPTSVMENTPDLEAIRSAERTRIAAITALGERHNMQDLARELIDGGRSLDESRLAVLDKLGSTAVPEPIRSADVTSNDIGLSDKEVKRFSFVRALNYLANQGDASARRSAEFEIEVGKAAAQQYERSSNGIVVPNEVLRRDMLAGIPSSGGNLVADELLSGSFIDLLRNRLALANAGVTVLTGMQGNFSIPRQNSASTAYWVGESGSPTESQPGVDQVNMTPKTVGAYVDYSRRLLLQSSIDVEGMVRTDLTRVIALELDRVGMYGTGSSNQPLGLINTTGIGGQTITTYGTFEEYIGMETDVAVANADAGSLRYIINAAARGALKSTPKSVSAVAAGFVYENNEINGYPVIVSNQLSNNDALFGDFSMLVMAMWSGLDLTVDPYAGATAGTVRVIALQDVDFGVKQPGAFCYGT
jgi:HK97 family phage major capsid protein/HK97 family phage prohead protease